MKVINITNTDFGEEKIYNIPKAFFKASIELEDNDNVNFRFVVLNITDNNHNIYDDSKKKEIYVSTNENLFNSENPYEYSEYKTLDYHQQIILTIPLEDIINTRKIYILIPCNNNNNICNYTFNFMVEDGKKLEGISIHDNSCFDIKLSALNPNEYYRFVYTIVDLDKSKHPLITFTSSSVNDFTILNAGLENEYLKRSFHNGYAFLFEYDQGYYEYHTFVLNTDYTSMFQICHRTIQKDDTTKIFVGQQVHSMIRNNFEVFMPDCFSIIKKEGENDYSSYILSIITITRNIDLIVYENEEKNTTNKTVINEEFFSTNLNKDIKKFCLNQSDDYNGATYSYIYSSIYFQILGVENGKKVQYTNAPLVNGLSVEQTLEKDEILYYRLNDYLEGSNQINIYLKKLEGEINLYKYICENIFNYSFDSKDFSVINQINFTDNNYINRMDGINNTENIYHKLSVPVYVVHCLETETNCKFIIELSNEKNYRLLIKNNRREINTDAYQGKNKENNEYNINGNEGNEFIFKTIYYAANLAGQYYNYYLEFHVLQGNVSNICVNGKMLDNGQIFERKFFYYINVTEDKKDFCSHVIKGTIEKGTNFYVNYRVLNLNDGNSETSRFFLPEKEMHYSLLVPNEHYLSYYFTENLESNDSYIVTMTGINSHFTSSEDERQIPEDRKKMGKYKQFIVNARDSIHFICMVYLDNEGNCLCESVVSASKLSKDSIIDKFVEFDGFYQYYNLDGKIKQINHYYSVSKSGDEYKLIDDKSKFLVIVNKNSLENLTINYGINHTNFYIKNETKTLYKLNEIFEVDLKELIKSEENKNIDNEFNTTINLFLTISSSYDMEIKIKTNMKNQFTYLDCDGTEIGYLNKGEALYYYFDYKFVNYYYHKQWNSWNIQGVYLANKGNVKMQAVVLENIPEQHTDMSDIDFSNTSLIYKSDYLNHFKIYNDGPNDSEGKCQKGCRFCFKVFLDEEDENNDNGRNLFTIYRFNQDLAFTVQLNENIYGFMYEANYEEYSYQIYVKNLGVDCLKITFNCRYCTLSIYKKREDKEFITNGIINKEEIYERFLDENGYIQFFLSGSESGYFFFSISDPNKPKYIEQLETERCYNKSCKFIFPLHDYYNYTKNRIILFVPDYKRIKIYYEMANMNKYENDYIPNFELDKKQKYKAEFRNYLIIDIDEKEKYLYMHATTEEDSENDFDFIMNQFLNSPNTEDIEFTKNIVDVYDTKEDFLRLKDDGFYEIDLYLINGNGTISIDHQNKIKYDYYLNYEYQESIKILIRYENIKNFKIQAKNLDDNNNFTFFINATLIDDDDDDNGNRFRQKLDSSKVYRFKYFKDNIFNPNLFPLKFQIPKIINKEVFINYRFIELKGAKTNAKKNQDYNIKDEIFKIEINNFQNINYTNIYYPEYMRGFFSMKINEQFEKDKKEYIDLDLDFNSVPLFPYDEVLLEINVLYIGNKDEEIIYLPKNAYIELAINANQSFDLVFSEYNSDYQKMYIELSNIFENNSTGEGESRLNCSKEINGKIVCNPEEQSEIYIMKIPQNSTGNILVKYTTIKNTVSSYPYFALNNNSIDFLDKKDDNNTFELTIHNIEKKLTGYLDFNLSYFIRLYSYLDFYNDTDVENILTKPTDMQSYKLDINNSKFLDKTIKHNISFGKLETKMYYISVIASVSYNDNVEYFAFKPHKFKRKASNEMSFEKNWVAPLVILIFLFIIIVSYIVYKIIESIKNKKSIQRRVTTDILINKANLENKD